MTDPSLPNNPYGTGPGPGYGQPPGHGVPPGYEVPPGYGVPPAYGDPYAHEGGYGRSEHAPTAIASLIFGVIGLTVLPLVGSIIALVLGYQSRTAAQAEPWRYQDELGKAGRILGWIGVVFYTGLLLAMLFLVLVPFALL